MTFNNTRMLRVLLALIFIFTLNFMIPRMMPGDPLVFLLGEDAMMMDQDAMDELRHDMGLDRPLLLQYLNYWGRVVSLDFGYSYHYNQKVSTLILSRIPWTLGLMLPVILLGGILGMITGAVAGWNRDSPMNRGFTILNLVVYSTPPYFLAMVCLYIFAVQWRIFPLKGFMNSGTLPGILHHYFLPVLILTGFFTSRNFLLMRGSVLQEKKKWYVLRARSMGIRGSRLLFGHVFKNAALPMVTMIALDFGFLFSGALLVEIVFSMNGMGTLMYEAVLSRDYPLLQGIFLVITLMVVSANLAAEVSCHRLDPRIRNS